jgi:hypothetical protein
VTAKDAEIGTLLDRVLTTFTGTGMAWALLRGRADLAVPGGDVDLLVAAAHQPVAEEVVFELGGVPRPEPRYPWHRMYVFDVPGPAAGLKLDIVNHLVYNRELQIASGLEEGCLQRRVQDGPLFLLSPTDTFWTILLHCVLDKQWVKEGRADELSAVVDHLDRPSPGEEFFGSLCPSDWSPERAVDCVVRRDWQSLSRLGSQIVSVRRAQMSTPATRDRVGPAAFREAQRKLVGKAVTRTARTTATGAAYFKAWRALGLVAVPDVIDVVEEARVDATVIGLTRRPGRCDVVLMVDDGQLARLLPTLATRYRPVAGAWRRLRAGGLESVRLVPASERPAERPDSADQTETSLLLPGREYCRLALASSG